MDLIKWLQNAGNAIQNNPTVQNVEKTVGNFNPVQSAISTSPGAQLLQNITGYKPPTVNDIVQHLSNQGKIVSAGTKALQKEITGQKMTAQDIADKQAYLQQTGAQVMGAVDAGGGVGAADTEASTATGQSTGRLVPKQVQIGNLIDSRGNPITTTQYLPDETAQTANKAQEQPQYAYGNQSSTTNTESEPQWANTATGGQQQTPYTPHPGVPEEPDIVTNRKGGNPVQVNLRNQAGKNSYYLQDQMHAQDVLDNYVPGASALEVERNLPKKLTEESQRISNIIGSNPQSVNTSDIIAENAANMAEKGFIPGENVRADKATTNLQKQMYSQLSRGQNSIVPDKMSGEDLQKQIQVADQRLQSVYKKMDNNTTLSPEDTAALTYRQTLSDQLKKMYPKAAQALDRQRGMMNAMPSVAKAADTEAASALAGGNKGNLLGNILKVGGIGAATAGVGIPSIYAAGEALKNYLYPNSTSTNQNTDTNPIPQGKDITDATGNPLILDKGTYDIQRKQLTDAMQGQQAGLYSYNPTTQRAAQTAIGQLQTKIDSLDNQFKSQGNPELVKAQEDASNQIRQLQSLKSMTENINGDYAFASSNPYTGAIKGMFDKNYSNWQTALDALHTNTANSTYPIDVTQLKHAGSKDSAEKVIDTQIDNIQKNFAQKVHSAGGFLPGEQKPVTGKDLINNISAQIVNPTPAPAQQLTNTPTPTPGADLFDYLTHTSPKQLLNIQ